MFNCVQGFDEISPLSYIHGGLPLLLLSPSTQNNDIMAVSHTQPTCHTANCLFHTVAACCVSLPLYQKQFHRLIQRCGNSNRILTVSSLNMYQLGLFEFSKNLINQAREANNDYNKWGSWYTSLNLLIVYCFRRWSKTTQFTHKDWRKEEEKK